MPKEVDEKVEAITESCMEKGDKTKEECENMAYAIVNSEKKDENTQAKR